MKSGSDEIFEGTRDDSLHNDDVMEGINMHRNLLDNKNNWKQHLCKMDDKIITKAAFACGPKAKEVYGDLESDDSSGNQHRPMGLSLGKEDREEGKVKKI